MDAGSLDRETVRRLSRRSNARGLMQLLVHLALLGATATWIWASRGTAWSAPAILAQGIALSFLFCALHETIHRTAFAGRLLNDGVSWMCGALLLLPPQFFRLFHFAHHRFTQDPARDPELAQPSPASFSAYLWRVSGMPNWHKRITVTVRHALTGVVPEPFVPATMHRTIVREARILWSCYLIVAAVSIYFHSDAALLYWIVPALCGQPFLRLFLLAEHTGCAFSEDMQQNTRTTHTNAAVRLISWQMPYHAEHHCFPAVPFHALAELNALIGSRMQVTTPGYLALHRELVRRLRATVPAGRAA